MRLMDDVLLIPGAAVDDMAAWVEDLDKALEPGMTVDDPDEVEVA
jgi:hypothetical protein